jgi:hypothetical protein
VSYTTVKRWFKCFRNGEYSLCLHVNFKGTFSGSKPIKRPKPTPKPSLHSDKKDAYYLIARKKGSYIGNFFMKKKNQINWKLKLLAKSFIVEKHTFSLTTVG